MTTELWDAVHGLTKPVIHVHRIELDTTTVRLQPTTLPPLLDQLEDAITSSLGKGGGGSAGKNTVNVLDSEALQMALTIKSQIIDWCLPVGVKVAKDAKTNLEAFATARPDAGDFYIRKMGDWARLIGEKLDPPKRREVLTPCPICKEAVWVDGDGAFQNHPIEITYKPDRALETLRAMCRACAAVWEGAEAVAELGDELAG